MTVQRLQRKQETWSKEKGSVDAGQIAPLDRASFLGSHSAGIHAGSEGKNRREFLTYIWAGTLTAMTVGTGLAAYQYLYPRRPAGEFGGRFYLGPASGLPPVGSEPKSYPEGRFWLVNTEKGLHALYPLCPHSWYGVRIRLWWDSAKGQIHCPACGSRFCPDGDYILGPSPRSLDQFVIEIVKGHTILAVTKLTSDLIEAPIGPSPEGEIVVDTGRMIQGPPSALTFPHDGISCLNM